MFSKSSEVSFFSVRGVCVLFQEFYDSKIGEVAIFIFSCFYRLLTFHYWYGMTWQIAITCEVGCTSVYLVVDGLRKRIFPPLEKTATAEEIQSDLQKTKNYMEKGFLYKIAVIASICIKNYMELYHESLDKEKLCQNFVQYALTILSASYILQYFCDYSFSTIKYILHYHLSWSVVGLIGIFFIHKLLPEHFQKHSMQHTYSYFAD